MNKKYVEKKKTNMYRGNRFLWFEYIAILIIIIAFFIISHCGFFMGDDIYMNYGVSTLSDVFEHTKMFYFTWGGRLFSVVSQYLFSGVLGNHRIWFVIANTLFYVLWIMTCGMLVNDSKKGMAFRVLLFALLFWFLCPAPNQTLFWTAASTTYLWANTLSFVFLFFYLKNKDDNFSAVGKLGLFIISLFSATEYITCASICGAFFVYYAFHIKKFNGNAVPFVVGFAIGSMLCLFSPGAFTRAGGGEKTTIVAIIASLFSSYINPVREITKYKALWIFLIVFALGWINNKAIVKAWVKNNPVLLLSLGWSVISYSIIFKPRSPRALFFTESLSLVLFLKFIFDNYDEIKIQCIVKFLKHNLSIIRSIIINLLFISFIVDSMFAVAETKIQKKNNDVMLKEIVESGGTVALDPINSNHRMAIVPGYWDWEAEPLADKYGLDSVHVYPYYCLDKYYNQVSPLEDVYVEINDKNRFEKEVRLIVRIENENMQGSSNPVVFTINYTRPRKWHKSWLDKRRNYQYDRTVTVEVDKPDCCFEGYCYYIIWLKRENAKNLKSVKYEF